MSDWMFILTIYLIGIVIVIVEVFVPAHGMLGLVGVARRRGRRSDSTLEAIQPPHDVRQCGVEVVKSEIDLSKVVAHDAPNRPAPSPLLTLLPWCRGCPTVAVPE